MSHLLDLTPKSSYYLQSVISHSGQQFYGSNLFDLNNSAEETIRECLRASKSMNDFDDDKMDFDSETHLSRNSCQVSMDCLCDIQKYSQPLFGN